jgi:hypothetical protein
LMRIFSPANTKLAIMPKTITKLRTTRFFFINPPFRFGGAFPTPLWVFVLPLFLIHLYGWEASGCCEGFVKDLLRLGRCTFLLSALFPTLLLAFAGFKLAARAQAHEQAQAFPIPARNLLRLIG